MSFILSCDFWFCCGSANDPECQTSPPYPQPTQPQTQVVTMLPPPAQQLPHISFNQLPPPLPAPALPPTFVYDLYPPGTTPSPHVPNGKACYPPPRSMKQQPTWPSTPLSRVSSLSKEYNVPGRPMTQQQPSCQSTSPSKAYDPLPHPTHMTPSRVPSTKVHEPVWTSSRSPPQAADYSNTNQMLSITNQQLTPPKVPSKRHETIVPTVVPTHALTPAPSSKVHKPLQSKQTVLHTNDEPPLSHIASQPPEQAVYPARQPSKTYHNLPSMNQQSMLLHVPSKRYETPVPAVAPKDDPPPVPSKVHYPSAQSKKAVLSCVPSAKAHDNQQPAQVSSQPLPQAVWLARQTSKTYPKSATMNQQLLTPPAPSKRYETGAARCANRVFEGCEPQYGILLTRTSSRIL
ncbi:unnamed protein product [Urochloa decumbens]|uniref:Extensin-like n=1 Tax=Urochloa decumbens TaxID=240449 RepID=A0ABC9G727_9POAL